MESAGSRRAGRSMKRLVLWVSLSVISLAAGLQSRASRPKLAALPRVQGPSEMVLNVKDLQATGDGRTDDTAAFARALSKLAVNGGTLLIPSGTYIVADLNVGSGTLIRGTGSPVPVLAKRPDAKSILDITASRFADSRGLLHDITIENVTLRGRSTQDGFSEHIHNLSAAGVERLSIQNVRFEAFQGDGIYLGTRRRANGEITHNSEIKIIDNVFEGANNENRNGISIIDCLHCVVEHNVFFHVSRPSMPGAIDIEPNQTNEVIRGVMIRNNTITGNNGGVGAISVALNLRDFLETPNQIVIEDNHIENSKYGITMLWRGAPLTGSTPSLNSVIRNNVVRGVDRPLTLDGTVGITVDENEFSDSRVDVQLGCGFGATGLHFIHNRFQRIGSIVLQGITMCGPISDVVFERNGFTDLGSAEKEGSAIYVARGTATNVRFTANTFSSQVRAAKTTIRLERGAASIERETFIWKENVLQNVRHPGSMPR